MMTTEEWNDKPTGGQDEIAALQARVAELERECEKLDRLVSYHHEQSLKSEARVAELEKKHERAVAEVVNAQKYAREQFDQAFAAEALLFEAVKAGMLEGAKVKPLVWEDFEGRGAKSPAFGMANYLIAKWDNRGFELSESCPGYGGPAIGERFYDTIDAAKAAAQADYEARIRGALSEPEPETIARIVAQLKEGRG